MSGRRGSKRTKASPAAGDDRITDLPLELRARIASFLRYRQVVQLSVLSRPWRRIHHHTPVVNIYLCDFLLFDFILAARVALARRAQDASASKVDTLRLTYFADDLRMRRHADRIVALADARESHVRSPKLRLLCWHNQFAEHVHIDVGRPGSVMVGTIEFMSVYFRKMEYYREQMMRMLQGLLPNVPPESVADIVRPYMTLEECPDSDSDDDTVEEKITCDLSALMSRGI